MTRMFGKRHEYQHPVPWGDANITRPTLRDSPHAVASAPYFEKYKANRNIGDGRDRAPKVNLSPADSPRTNKSRRVNAHAFHLEGSEALMRKLLKKRAHAAKETRQRPRYPRPPTIALEEAINKGYAHDHVKKASDVVEWAKWQAKVAGRD